MTLDTNPVYFMHYRRRDTYGSPLSQGGATLAIRPMGGNVIRVAMAQCSDKDIFNKKLGRTIAQGRLFSAQDTDPSSKYVFDIIAPETDMAVKEAVHTVMARTMHGAGLE